MCKKVKVSNDQEMAQSEKNPTPKILLQGGKNKLTEIAGTCTNTKRTYRKPSEQLLPNRLPLSYTDLTKYIKT